MYRPQLRDIEVRERGVRRWLLLNGAALLLALALLPLGADRAAAHAAPNLRVRGNVLVDGPGRGHVVQLRGVNRSGLEYACIQGWGFFDGPNPDQIDDQTMIAAIKSWNVNVVRLPLNEDCWLGLHTRPGRGGAAYRRIVERYVKALHAAGLYVILDLHWAAPGRAVANGQIPMIDRDHGLAFWRSVARSFKRDRALIFDLYNEPTKITWNCWRRGCRIPRAGARPSYQSAGMQQLVNAVRSVGARQPLMLGGIDYSLNLSHWLANEPRDRLHQLIASEHNYGVLAPCNTSCRAAIVTTSKRVPVELGEFGETDCRDAYADAMMRFADAHRIGYLAWAWDAVTPGGWTCKGGPSLIANYLGTPTAYGIGVRDHLLSLGVPRRIS
jgi:hypothetical protein